MRKLSRNVENQDLRRNRTFVDICAKKLRTKVRGSRAYRRYLASFESGHLMMKTFEKFLVTIPCFSTLSQNPRRHGCKSDVQLVGGGGGI